MKRISSWLAALVVLAPLTASAESLVELGTVTNVYRYSGSFMHISGIALGTTTVQTYNAGDGDQDVAAACERAAYLVMTHPGRYVLELHNTACAVRPAS